MKINQVWAVGKNKHRTTLAGIHIEVTVIERRGECPRKLPLKGLTATFPGHFQYVQKP